MRNLRLLILAVIAFSCQDEKREPPLRSKPKSVYETGAWDFDSIVSRKTSVYHARYDIGFKLYPDGVCDYKRGFYKLELSQNDDLDSKIHYLGIRTTYTKTVDSLKIADRDQIDGKGVDWLKFGLVKETDDFLFLSDKDNNIYRYKRHLSAEAVGPHYDGIVVSRGGCFGPCPINSTMITSKGELFFFGSAHNTVNGFQIGKIGVKAFDSIQEQFRKLNVHALADGYWDYQGSCGQENQVTYIKDGMIAKTISVYTPYSGPIDLFTAYNGVSYLHQTFPVKPAKMTAYSTYWNFTNIANPKKQFWLGQSNGFYLACELHRSQRTNVGFTPTYTLKYERDIGHGHGEIETDGRYYKIFKDGEHFTLDLGYNFLARNPILRSHP